MGLRVSLGRLVAIRSDRQRPSRSPALGGTYWWRVACFVGGCWVPCFGAFRKGNRKDKHHFGGSNLKKDTPTSWRLSRTVHFRGGSESVKFIAMVGEPVWLGHAFGGSPFWSSHGSFPPAVSNPDSADEVYHSLCGAVFHCRGLYCHPVALTWWFDPLVLAKGIWKINIQTTKLQRS